MKLTPEVRTDVQIVVSGGPIFLDESEQFDTKVWGWSPDPAKQKRRRVYAYSFSSRASKDTPDADIGKWVTVVFCMRDVLKSGNLGKREYRENFGLTGVTAEDNAKRDAIRQRAAEQVFAARAKIKVEVAP